MIEADLNNSHIQPSGVALKAAYLLLQELNKSPEPPCIERVAVILDSVLNYEWAVRLIRELGSYADTTSELDGFGKALRDFNEWSDEMLLG